MSGAFRTYRGLLGERIPVPADSFATVPRLHDEPQPFPFARMAAALGPLRDRFAQAVNRAGLHEEAMTGRTVQELVNTICREE